MSKVKDGNFYVIQSFMVKDLKLKGLEKDIYAIIYGFSQAEGQVFNGSLQYLCDWTFSSRQGVMNALKRLVEKGLIIKKEVFINNVKFVEYSAIEFTPSQESLLGVVNKVDGDSQESLLGDSQQSLHNNISINNIDYNIEDKIEDKIDKEDKALRVNLSIIENEVEVKVHSLTAELIKRNFIDANDLEIYKYNKLFEEVLNEYEFSLVCKVINYVISKMKDNASIKEKFGYFKFSLIENLEIQVKRENKAVEDHWLNW